jgi:hypothetical protein
MNIFDNNIEFCCDEMWNRVLVDKDVHVFSDCVCIETWSDGSEDMQLEFCPFCGAAIVIIEDVEDCCGECDEDCCEDEE